MTSSASSWAATRTPPSDKLPRTSVSTKAPSPIGSAKPRSMPSTNPASPSMSLPSCARWRPLPGSDQRESLARGLSAETAAHRGYATGDRDQKVTTNSRNSSYPKNAPAETDDIEITVPRDSERSFTPRLMPRCSRRVGGLEDMAISMYAGGMTIRDTSTIWAQRAAPSSPTSRSRTSSDGALHRVGCCEVRAGCVWGVAE